MPETRQREVHYPESDGKPLAESDFHFEVIIDLIHALQTHYGGEPDVYVGGNLLLYYVEGIDETTSERLLFVEEERPARLAERTARLVAQEHTEQETKALRALAEEIDRLRRELGQRR